MESKLWPTQLSKKELANFVLHLILIFLDVWSRLSRDQLPVCQVWPEQGLLLDAGLKAELIGGVDERVCGKNRSGTGTLHGFGLRE